MLETKKKKPFVNKYTQLRDADKNGTKRPLLPKILMKAYNTVNKHGARANPEMMIDFYFDKSYLQRSNSKSTFDKLVSFIFVNVNLADGSFTKFAGTQKDIAIAIGMSQSTVSRHINEMIRLGWITHAFCGANNPRDPKSGLACKSGIPLNNFYCITDKFPYLLGSKFGDEFLQVMLEARQKADRETGSTREERMSIARSTLHEATIEARAKEITKSTQAKKIKKVSDRSRAVELIVTRLKRTGAIFDMAKEQLERHVNAMLKYCGYGQPHPT